MTTKLHSYHNRMVTGPELEWINLIVVEREKIIQKENENYEETRYIANAARNKDQVVRCQ